MSNKILTCCGQNARKAKTPDGIFYIHCPVCNKRAEGPTADEAEQNFENLQDHAPVNTLPATASQLPAYMVSRLEEIAALTVPFVARDKPALTRLLKNNMRHIMLRSKDTKFAEVWQTPGGVESIVFAIEEAMALGAELGKMGSVVPFGTTVEFIPAVEAYEFALTNGGNPPFSWIQIDMIHKNDICEVSRVNGEFSCKIKPNIPRGELVAVAVYGHNNRLGHVIGEVYDRARLLGKAERHSTSYKYYLQDLNAFNMARTEGKVQTEGSRQFINKTMYKKGGATWKKKLYFDEITNPYEGPDQPEMLRKAAGKSFLGKYAKVRNSESAMDEIKGTPEKEVEKTIDASLDAAFDVMAAEPVQTEQPPVTMEDDGFEEDPPEVDPEDISDELEALDASRPKISSNTKTDDVGTLMDKVKQKAADNSDEPEQELDIF